MIIKSTKGYTVHSEKGKESGRTIQNQGRSAKKTETGGNILNAKNKAMKLDIEKLYTYLVPYGLNVIAGICIFIDFGR